jgi:hypothetical protein
MMACPGHSLTQHDGQHRPSWITPFPPGRIVVLISQAFMPGYLHKVPLGQSSRFFMLTRICDRGVGPGFRVLLNSPALLL